ncbi:hypothetical protein EPA93_42510 [Ktedonosporobacter rubrisoli]|uniref:Uncharacterized protein n=1 Tax=Ktedonosporobacter rubrisoli TaxID=2509675 RepID=A0A4P6K3G1_KTERU|nr:hypothetical protein [Ktedonosporobacter rubrisoli]QBD82300.1 hypothetical protein EPA93_42510 [Ktedonosporobacter rubrisoli]
MQQAHRRELPEQMSWARAVIFAVGFFFIAAILIGQLPGYVFLQMTAATLDGLERGCFGLAVVCLGGFIIIQVITMLFDPKPVIPPAIFTTLGVILTAGGLALAIWCTTTGCTPTNPDCNQYFPRADTIWNPVLGGKILWFEPKALDLLMLGVGILGVGLAMIFYSILAMNEQRNPERHDPGTTPAIRWLIVIGTVLLLAFVIAYSYVDDKGLAHALFPAHPYFGHKLLMLIITLILGAAIVAALGAFLLRLHYLMRPARKRTMAPLYAVGALGLAQTGAIFLVLGIVVYPLVSWIHTWSFIGLNEYLVSCAKSAEIPQSCTFSQMAGYLVDAIITTNFFVLLMAAIWAWKSNRNVVIIGSFVTVAAIGAATLLLHMAPEQLMVAMILCGAMLILVGIWTSVARREFAVVGEKNLGCLGQWLIMGTCLFIYLGSFALFSLPVWDPETETNIPFVAGQLIPPPTVPGEAPPIPANDAVVLLVLMAILAGIQFYFLARNRYKA